MANENMNSPKDAAMAILAKAQKLLDKKSSAAIEDIKIEDMKKSAEHTSGLHTVAYYGLDKHSAQQAALAVLAKSQDMLSETVSARTDGLKKSAEAESGMHRVEYYNLAKKENPDEKQDAQLGEDVENLCEDHMIANKDAERKEGHRLVSKAECAKCVGGMQKSEFSDLYADLEEMAKAEKPDENEIGTKFLKDEGQGSGIKKQPSNDMKPRVKEQGIERDYNDFETKPGHAPENDHREAPQASPEKNPVEQKEGNNPPAGAAPANKNATGATPGTGKKGVHKLSFFMGHCHSKKNMKKGIALG
jgi:hypothetical protein